MGKKTTGTEKRMPTDCVVALTALSTIAAALVLYGVCSWVADINTAIKRTGDIERIESRAEYAVDTNRDQWTRIITLESNLMSLGKEVDKVNKK